MTEYRHNSHADVIVSRLLLTDMLDGTGRDSPLKLASLYTDQKPANDISRLLAASHRFPIKSKIADALTLGTGKLAVDGVLLVAEHGDYPFSATGNHQYPKRRFWDETIRVFRESGRVVPVFITVDPERDTPAQLKSYLKSFGPGFVGFTGDGASIARVAADYRVYFRKHPLDGGGYGMDHSSVIYLVGPDGKLAAFYDEQMTPDALAKSIAARV